LYSPQTLTAPRLCVQIETKGLTLEETSALFDGEEATGHIVGHALPTEVRDEYEEKGDHSPGYTPNAALKA